MSKVAVVGAVDEEGMNIDANKSRWDVVYKFGQVEVKKPAVDWYVPLLRGIPNKMLITIDFFFKVNNLRKPRRSSRPVCN